MASDFIPRKKLVCVGDGGCGKTALLTVFSTGQFPELYIPTVFECSEAVVLVDGNRLQLSLWDTAGQEEYERLRPLSYADSNVVLICFDVTEVDSLENVTEKWFSEVSQHVPGVPIILVGLKTDLRNDRERLQVLASRGQRPMTFEEGLAIASRIGAARYVECSARQNHNVNAVFEAAARAALKGPAPAPTTSEGSCCRII
ncbi:GTP-binding protein rho1 [Zopfochytrium polystomum]|nr:GTP-binding protein rho1 [Zopfochytrium polystomum]